MLKLDLPVYGNRKKIRVGLLGGSFNPAHEGHLHISLIALKKLNLNEIWWLVSPQNPLKPKEGMADFEKRFNYANKIAVSPFIKVCDLEKKLKTTYTIDTLRELKKRFPLIKFVWLMGADNMLQITRWKDWQKIFETIPIAVFDRNQYACQAPLGKAARRFSVFRIKGNKLNILCRQSPPAWGMFHIRKKNVSSSFLRKQGKEL